MKSKGQLIYITEHGSKIGVNSERLYVRLRGSDKKQFFNLNKLEGIIIGANVSLSSKLFVSILDYGVTCIFLDSIGRFSAKVEGRKGKNIFARKYQARVSSDPQFVLGISKKIVEFKIESMLSCYFDRNIHSKLVSLEKATAHDQVLGIEGIASRIYFNHLRKDLNKLGVPFFRRTYYPPEDEGNALLSLAYTLLMAEVSIVVNLFDLDLGWGFLHKDYYGREGLICDIMEPFRSIYADKYVLYFVKKYKVTVDDFNVDGKIVFFVNPEKKKAFYKDFRESFMTEVRRDNILFFVREIYNHIVDDGYIYFQRKGLLA